MDKLQKNVFLTAGLPKYLVCDRAAEFTATQMKEVLNELAVTQKLCTTFNPTSNSAAERLNRTVLQLLRSLLLDHDEKNWDDLLPLAIYFYNAGYHRSLGNTPFYLMYGRDPNIPYEAILSPIPHHDGTPSDRAASMARCLRMAREAIVNTQDQAMALANTRSKNKVDAGDIVYIRERYVSKRDHKLLPKYSGPLRVIDLLGPPGTPGACILKSFKTGRTRQVSLKDVKLLQNHVATKTENGNVGEAFPTIDINADVPDTVQSTDISRHSDVTYDVDCDAAQIGIDKDIPMEDVSEKTASERSMPAMGPMEDTLTAARYKPQAQVSRPAQKAGSETLGTAVSKRVAGTGGGDDATPPVATRAKTRSMARGAPTTRKVTKEDNIPGVVKRPARNNVDGRATNPGGIRRSNRLANIARR